MTPPDPLTTARAALDAAREKAEVLHAGHRKAEAERAGDGECGGRGWGAG